MPNHFDLQIKFTKSSRKHRIGKAHVIHVIKNCEPKFRTLDGVLQIIWLGADDRGLELEILGILDGDLILVIHVMPSKYRKGKQWLI